ncbi:MAG: DUF4325 domain-containing protein [Candidatus Parcubacteria bacterium]|nr:DUF4325 domain-containing protein [Candidatus Parcubacteria bacterium]
MKIYIKKFGTMLVSRPAGKEASLAYEPLLKNIQENEPILVDFDGVIVMSPSWCAEFLDPLFERFGERLVLENTTNPSVKATLDFLEGTYHKKFERAE